MSDFPALQPDEEILWEGRPDTKLRFGMATMATGIFAVALVLACLGLATVIDRANTGSYWAILAPGIVVGVVIVFAGPVVDSLTRYNTRYRLTNQRMLITKPIGVRSASYPIPPLDDLIYRNGTPPSIYFATQINGRTSTDIGFERIADAREVFIQMRKLAGDTDL